MVIGYELWLTYKYMIQPPRWKILATPLSISKIPTKSTYQLMQFSRKFERTPLEKDRMKNPMEV